jgi:hypothetical protein
MQIVLVSDIIKAWDSHQEKLKVLPAAIDWRCCCGRVSAMEKAITYITEPMRSVIAELIEVAEPL